MRLHIFKSLSKPVIILLLSLFPVLLQAQDQHTIDILERHAGTYRFIHSDNSYVYFIQGYIFKIAEVSGFSLNVKSSLTLPQIPFYVSVDGNIAAVVWIAGGVKTFAVIDLSDKNNPIMKSQTVFGAANESMESILVHNNRVFLGLNTDWDNGVIRIYSLSDLANPTLLIAHGTRRPHKMCASGNYLYCITGNQWGTIPISFRVYNISNITAPTEISNVAVPLAGGLTILDNYAYVYGEALSNRQGITIIDITNPTTLNIIADSKGPAVRFNNIYVKEPYAYCAGSNDLYILNITDKANPTQTSRTITTGIWYSAFSFNANTSLAFLASNKNVLIYDIASATTPIQKDPFIIPTDIAVICLTGNNLFAGDRTNIFLFKTDDPNYENKILSVDHDYIAASATTLFTNSEQQASIKLYDITNVINPVLRSTYNTTDGFLKFIENNGYLYVISFMNNKLEIVDVRNPSSPQKVSEFNIGGSGRDVYILNGDPNSLYVAYYATETLKGFKIIDISNKNNPTIVGQAQTTQVPRAVRVNNNHAFVASTKSNTSGWYLQAFDISNKQSPTAIAEIKNESTLEVIYNFDVVGNVILVCFTSSGFKTYELTSTLGSLNTKTNQPNLLQHQFIQRGTNSSISNPRDIVTYTIGSVIYGYTNNGSWSASQSYKQGQDGIEKFKDQVPTSNATLAISILPQEAYDDGCRTNPLPGNHNYNINSLASLEAIEKPEKGWFFKEWTGDVSGTNKHVDVTMDRNKNAVANFAKVLLTVAGSRARDAKCPEDFKMNKTYNMLNITLTASNADGWDVNAITLDSDGSGNEVNDIQEIQVFLGAFKLFSGPFTIDNGTVTATFTPAVKINPGQSVTLALKYNFKFDPSNYAKDTIKTFTVAATTITAKPWSFENGLIQGSASTQNLVIARVFNIREYGFAKIQEGIDATTTLENDSLYLCPCTFEENVNVTKPLTIKSMQGKLVTHVTAKQSNEHVFNIKSNNVTIDGLTITGATGNSRSGLFANQIISPTVSLKNLVLKLSTLTGNDYGALIQGSVSHQDSFTVDINNCEILNNNNDGIKTTAGKVKLILTEDTIRDNQNGVTSECYVFLQDIVLSNNKKNGIYSKEPILLRSTINKQSMVINNKESGLNSEKRISIDGDGILKIIKNTLDGIHSSSGQTTLDIKSAVIDSNDARGVYCNSLIAANARIRNNKSDGIMSEAETIIGNSNISDNTGNGIWARGFVLINTATNTESIISHNELNGITSESPVFTLGEGKVTINKNGKCGIISTSGESKLWAHSHEIDSNGTQGINCFSLIGFNTHIRNNKDDGVFSSSSVAVTNPEIINNLGNGIWSGGSVLLASNKENNSLIAYNKKDGVFCRQSAVLWGDGKFTIRKNTYSGLISNGGYVRFFISSAIIDSNGVYGVAGNEIIASNADISHNRSHGILALKSLFLYNVRACNNDGSGAYVSGDEFVLINTKAGTQTSLSGNKQDGLFSNANITTYGDGTIYFSNNIGKGINSPGRKNKLSADWHFIEKNKQTGILAKELTMTGTCWITKNEEHGIVTDKLEIKNSNINNNYKYGIIIVGPASNSKIGENVSIEGNLSGGIYFANPGSSYKLSSINTLSPTIFGCNIIDNKGDGIRNDASCNFSVSNSNISKNSGFGINNLKAGTEISALSNWWGNTSGPSGGGSGSGDKVSSNVIFANWLQKPLSVTIASEKDTIYSYPNRSDTVKVTFKNYQNLNDRLNIVISDSLNWLSSPKNFSVDLKDSAGTKTNFMFLIPQNSTSGTKNRVRVIATSAANSSNFYEKSIYNFVYSPTVSKLEIAPTKATIGKNKQLQFTAKGYDQHNNQCAFTPTWATNKGIITNDRIFTAPNETGLAIVSVKCNSLQTDAFVNIVEVVPSLSKILVFPDSTKIAIGEWQQFYAIGVDQFDSVTTLKPRWSATGGIIDMNGLFIAGNIPGKFKVTVTDSLAIIKGEAVVIIQPQTGIREQDLIPSEFKLFQNYPNPFNPETIIEFSIPPVETTRQVVFTTLKIYDVLGREVETLVNEYKQSGYYKIIWNPKFLASGVYFYRITCDAFSQTKKFVLLR